MNSTAFLEYFKKQNDKVVALRASLNKMAGITFFVSFIAFGYCVLQYMTVKANVQTKSSRPKLGAGLNDFISDDGNIDI